MPLRGKIDRVDFNHRTGEWMILDYKTSDSGHGPIRIHHGSERISDEWLDLQLPLYRHLARAQGIEGTVRLGYVLLPKHPPERAFELAEWSDDQLAAAIDSAREIVRKIRAGTFAPNPDYHSDFDEFVRVCQATAFGNEQEFEEGME
jgi:ATP-dependent helicase/DNAse subunit B